MKKVKLKMITVNKLKQLIDKIPSTAHVNIYEGEDIGINIFDPISNKNWWIRIENTLEEDTYTEGFNKIVKLKENPHKE